MIALLKDHCSSLSAAEASAVKPLSWKAMSATAVIVIGEGGLHAAGRAVVHGDLAGGEYSEDVALGTTAGHAEIHRWVGGNEDGLLEVTCSNADATEATMALRMKQAAATLAAKSGEDRPIDLQAAIQQAAAANPDVARLPSNGAALAVCDTSGIDVQDPAPGGKFSCTLSYFFALPDFVAEFETTDSARGFEMTGSRGSSDSAHQAVESPSPVPSEEAGDVSTPTGLGDPSNTPTSSTSDTCEAAPEFGPETTDCAGAMALVEQCGLEPPFSVAAWDRVGITEWKVGPDAEGHAVTSQDSGTFEPSVLSCGETGNGVDVLSLHDDVWRAAEDGWGIEAMSVTCHDSGGGILNTLPPGASGASCAVANAAGGAPGYAFISITSTAPYYSISLGE